MIVVVGAAIAAWWLWPDASAPVAEDGDGTVGRRIREATPAKARTNEVRQVAAEKKTNDFEKYNRLMTQAEIARWKRPANWDQLSPAEKTRIMPVGRIVDYTTMGGGRPRFHDHSDCMIERLLMVEPGGMILGEGVYGPHFVKSFLESLKTPIEITPEDTEEDIAVKNEVIACRKDLKEAYDRGEDICEIMKSTERELHELSAYSLNLQGQYMTYLAEGEHSQQDLKDFADAVNMMLKEKGLEPIRFAGIHRSREKLNHMKKEMKK